MSEQCVNLRSNTNVMILRIPHRYDLSIDSCVNKEVVTFNRKLHKLMRNKLKVKMLFYEITSEDFTSHGLHLNATGKTTVAKTIAQNLLQLYEDKKTHPITLQWKLSYNDSNLNRCTLKVSDTDHMTSINPLPMDFFF